MRDGGDIMKEKLAFQHGETLLSIAGCLACKMPLWDDEGVNVLNPNGCGI